MDKSSFQKWDALFLKKAQEIYPPDDPSHDLLHIRRVVACALKLAAEEKADLHVVLPAAYLHDFVNVPKNDPRRAEASRISAVAATGYLRSIGYPEEYLDKIRHAIEAHSFSAGITPETIEAKVVQDADRLDALGAVGIARAFTVNGQLGTPHYCSDEFFVKTRDLDDRKYAIDHFFIKFFKLPAMMQTAAARVEAERRVEFMRRFLEQMYVEVQSV